MATKIDANEYGNLKDFSASSTAREKGPFLNVSICGKPRKGQTVGTMQCLNPGKSYDSPDGPDKYLFVEKKLIYVILMFLRRVRCKYEKRPGKEYESLTYFCWNPTEKDSYPQDAKIEWVFAGAVMDENLKVIMDPVEQERAAFVYFRNKGVKCGKAFEFINTIGKKSEDLQPLSNDAEFEKNVVTPRRFITEVTIDIFKHPEYGGMYVFNYNLFKQLPDEKVKDIMDRSKNWVAAFEKQFNLTEYIKGGGTVVSSDDGTAQEDPNKKIDKPTFKDNETADKDKVQKTVAADFELPGI
jgi:hypothetical protein